MRPKELLEFRLRLPEKSPILGWTWWRWILRACFDGWRKYRCLWFWYLPGWVNRLLLWYHSDELRCQWVPLFDILRWWRRALIFIPPPIPTRLYWKLKIVVNSIVMVLPFSMFIMSILMNKNILWIVHAVILHHHLFLSFALCFLKLYWSVMRV